jgi:hypothetical protein
MPVGPMAIEDADTIARALGGQRKSDDGWLCRCPVKSHGRKRGDLNPSLKVTDGDARLLVFCHAGCESRDVLDALRLLGLLSQYRSLTAEDRAEPASSSVVERYLRRRGIDIPIPPAIRAGVIERPDNQGSPAMIAAVHALDGTIIAVQRTRLTWKAEKANVRRPRLTFGELGDGAVRLADCVCFGTGSGP